MPSVGPLELIIVLVIAVLILGPKRIPAAARSVGEGIRGFRGTLKSGETGADEDQSDSPIEEKNKTGV